MVVQQTWHWNLILELLSRRPYLDFYVFGFSNCSRHLLITSVKWCWRKMALISDSMTLVTKNFIYLERLENSPVLIFSCPLFTSENIECLWGVCMCVCADSLHADLHCCVRKYIHLCRWSCRWCFYCWSPWLWSYTI